MTYDSRKARHGQEFVEEIELVLDRCKYTDQEYIDNQYLDVIAFYGPGHTGDVDVYTLSSAFMSFWGVGVPLYAAVENTSETIKFEIIDDQSILIHSDGRGQFGSLAETLSGRLRIMHQGEADGSCRGFPHTCSSPNSYSPTSKIRLRFSTAPSAGGTQRFGGLEHGAVRHDAGEVDPGESIGTRSRLRFTIKDQVHDDEYIVPYVNRRSSQGTMFGKLLARHPYMVGREVIYREGYRDRGTFSEPDYIERVFIIDSTNLSDDKFTVTALDPLTLTEDKRAKMPVASPAILAGNIDTSNSAFNYLDAPDYYFGPASATVYLRIDSEVMRCTVTGPKQLTPDLRGYRSENKEHEAGASIQDCVVFQGTNGIDAIVFALTNYTKIDSKYIGDYSAVKALLPAFVLDDCVISKPTPVQEFIDHLVKLGDLIFYYDEIAQKIVIDYIPELSSQPISINERQHITRDSVKVDFNLKNQWTRFQHLWAPVDVTKDSEENYAIRYLAVNIGLESQGNMGQANEKKAYKNPILTNSTGDSLLGASYASRVIERNSEPPKIISLNLDAQFVGNYSGGNLALGSIISLYTKENQDISGSPLSELFQVLSLKGNGYNGYDVKARRYQTVQQEDVDFVISTSATNFDLSTVFAPPPGQYTVYINPDVVLSSLIASMPAFTTGSQSAGVSFRIIHRGRILGMGGDGGNAGYGSTKAQPGQNGGAALEATVPLIIDSGSGIIWAGGGGGAGQFAIAPQGPVGQLVPRKGGGGGQGYGVSAGGRNSDGASLVGRAPSGSQAGPGDPGQYAAAGGEWGENGVDIIGWYGPTPPDPEDRITRGGLAGEAIKSNGNPVTIVAGDNEINIRGRRT